MKLRHAMKGALSTVTFATVACAFVFQPLSSARAAEYTTITADEALALGAGVGGDEIRRIDNGNYTYDIIHLFTNVTSSSSITFADDVKFVGNARVLIVGGGGAGNGNCGAGGGAGGFVELDNIRLTAGSTITASVGAGGEATRSVEASTISGSDSTLAINGTTYTAAGGGGGGCYTTNCRDGASGGSGGGATGDGTVGSSTQASYGYGVGNAGGAGSHNASGGQNIGGGGGGAGGPGGDATFGSSAGVGGDGVTSDISGETMPYAAGGGGGRANNAGVDGGYANGEMIGGAGSSPYTSNASAGRANTGSGGGGGGGGTNSGSTLGGAGGSGIVIVRYTIPTYYVNFNGEDIYYKGGETNWVDGELVVSYASTTSSNTLILPKYVQADVLVVGGGGSGANPTTSATGGAGGGGAGGLILTNSWALADGTYSIVVGAGGVAQDSATRANGNNGEDSSISLNGSDLLVAYGGGGGGTMNAAGLDGGSGGGGSRNQSGGSATQPTSAYGGYGNAGGSCAAVARCGAGGGGAGGAGGSATTAGQGGAGGAGLECDITGTATMYAGGGGGGARGSVATDAGGAGGSGVGGDGGNQTEEPGAGKDGTGSGGGGGGQNQAGGSGGSGIVIIRIKMVMPEKPTQPADIDYDGLEHVVCEANEAYVLTGASATDAGTYNFTATLNDGYTWSDGTADTVTFTWTIVPAELYVESFTLEGWQVGEPANTPELVVTAGQGGTVVTLTSDQITYTYSSDQQTWTTDAPTTVGTWYVRATIASSGNYSAPDTAPEASFTVWAAEDSAVTELAYHAYLTVNTGYSGGTLTDFPMLVRLQAGTPQGFDYNQTLSDGSDLRFYATDATGAIVTNDDGSLTPLPYEIESWDPDGESIVWVKVPRYEADTTVAVMYWGLVAGTSLPATSSDTVWTGFNGVWHMGETIDAASASTAVSADSSATGNDASPTGGDYADLTQMVSVSGMVGNGRVNSTSTSVAGGNRLLTASKTGLTSFTFSGWYQMYAQGGCPRLVGDKHNNLTPGWSVETVNNSSTYIAFRDSNAAMNTVTFGSPVGDMLNSWVYLTFVVDGTSLSLYSNGSLVTTVTISELTDSGYSLAFGSNSNGGEYSLNGAYDELRITAEILTADWIMADYLQMGQGQAGSEFGGTGSDATSPFDGGGTYVTPDSTLENHWVVEPSVSATEWDEGATEPTLDLGEPAYGTVYYVFTSLGGVASTNAFPTAAGTYELVFHVDAGTTAPDGTLSWTDLESDVIICTITEHSPQTDLAGAAGSATLSGRVLLANDDTNADAPIDGQEYDRTADVATDVYWIHSGDTAPSAYSNLDDGSEHTLVAGSPVDELCGATNIWTLSNVFLGSTYDASLQASFKTAQNRLPYSSTSASSAARATYMVMRNVTGATITSPCYTNGIGTIYFDAVNGSTTEAGTGYNLVLEVVTGDAAMAETIADSAWTAVGMIPLMRDSGGFDRQAETTELALSTTAGGDGESEFYRVYAPLDEHGPIRFRLRRTTAPSGSSFSADEGGFILIDNIIASYPAMRADLSPYGWYDGDKAGKQTLGQELAWDVPFPSVSDTVKPRAAVEFYTNPGDTDADTGSFITTARIHYRWRYLDQKIGDWKTVALAEDSLMARSALDFSDGASADGSEILQGDIEFWYDLVLNAPYYSYVDYASLSGFKMSDYYSEEIAAVTNCSSGVTYASQGTNWFVRLREGQSDIEAFEVEIWSPDDEGDFVTVDSISADGSVTNQVPADLTTVSMEVIDDHIWRGYFKTLNVITNGVRFRVKALNEQTPGATEWATNTTVYVLSEESDSIPISSTLSSTTDDDTWSSLTVDAVTGYLMFQIEDDTRAVTIVHADYQNFNAWNDANNSYNYFVGSSTSDDSKSGASASSAAYSEDFAGWVDMPATNAYWVESFTTGTTSLDEDDYTTFSSATTPNGWTAGQGMWVYGRYKDSSTGRALQMQGQGVGYLQFVDAAVSPRGLEKVSYNARLGQFINFTDFSYYDGDSKAAMTNYTFTTRAAFDYNCNTNFTGDGSLSLVAYYRPGKGCYEFRYERTASSTLLYSLYRWVYDKSTGRMNKTLLTSHSFGNSLIETTGETGDFAAMYISVSNAVDGSSCIMAGVHRNAAGYSTSLQTLASGRYDSICYRDSSDDKLTAGTYGVLSANCDGVFQQLYYMSEPVPFSSDNITANGSGYYSASESNDTGEIPLPYSTATSCKEDLSESGNDAWYISPGRMTTFASTSNTSVWGLKGLTPTQTVILYTASAGKTDWKPLATNVVDTFGTTEPFTFELYTTDDCSVKLAAGGDLDDVRTDIIIDDVEITQWRGDSWDNMSTTYIPNWDSENNVRSHTNFIFTCAWITNETLRLSAKRTSTDEACSIRSPLFDGSYGRGIGLGMFSFTYKNAQPTARLLLQIATNVSYSTINSINTPDNTAWQTVTNYTFVAGEAGTRSYYFGLHGVEGAMRLIVDPDLVEEAQDSDDPKYGEIYITEVYCRDEPALDATSWWGWNLRTFGVDANGDDSEYRMYLPDLATKASELGMSLALNNSVKEETDPADEVTYAQHMPFVQTPTFTSNVVGEVRFKARKYDTTSKQPAQVTLYGSKTSGASDADNMSWDTLQIFIVSNDTFAAYSYTTEPNDSYIAFRLGVAGISEVIDSKMDNSVLQDYSTPVRVVLDEVLVSEAVRARMAFRNVGAFRTGLDTRTYVSGVPSTDQQPLCDESWGVQCEIYASQLADEIDLDRTPLVKLHWYMSDYPWGYENWKDLSGAQSAWLARATDTNLVYRSSYLTAPDAVVSASTSPGSTVQYMLEVVYYQKESNTPSTNFLTAADWSTPSWYRPIDKNAGEDYFSAYNILDTVAPGWAWINESNILGEYVSWANSEADYQFVEIAVPAEADITGWRVEYVEEHTSYVITNTFGVFGSGGLSSTKTDLIGMASNMVFRVLGNAASKSSGNLKVSDGTLDAVWNVPNPTTYISSDGEITAIYAIGLRLLRASGIIEHEIVLRGQDYYSSDSWLGTQYSPTTAVTSLNSLMSGSDFIYVGDDNQGNERTIGVLDGNGSETNDWYNTLTFTPGRINVAADGTVQNIDPDHPTPNGSSILIYANLDTSLGHIYQTIGELVDTNASTIITLQKGSARGTNITYRVDPWFQLGSVTTNGIATTVTELTEPRTYQVTVGVGASNNVTVVASAQVKDSLLALGVTEDNKYRDAILDWLVNHQDAFGNDWANPDTDEVYLADFLSLYGTVVTNLTLTEMFWLDMDPTVSNLALKAGMASAPSQVIVDNYSGTAAVTNLRMSVFMQITNRTEDASSPYYGQAWPPYILRSADPGVTSWDYRDDNSWRWSNETFKITGILANGLTKESNANNWIPLRFFVFDEHSFETNTFLTHIEIKDPFGTESPGYSGGWYDWVQEHGATPVFFRWAIDERILPYTIEVLSKTNYYEYATP